MSDAEEFDRAVIRTEKLDATHNADLEDLIEEWRTRARTHRDRECQLEIENCADELERVINDG